MKDKKKKIISIAAFAVGFILICSLTILAVTAATRNVKSGDAANDTEAALTVPELTQYDLTDATGFVFSDSGIEVAEGAYSGYKAEGTALEINKSGTYVVSGSCANGTIVVKKNVTGVTLVLNGLDLSASATAPITCNKGSEVLIIAAEGTVNDLADDEYNNDDVYTDEELYPDIENAVIKCKDGSNVTICGTGTINVTANGKNGVKGGYDLYEEDAEGNATDTLLSEASLTVKEVTLNITADVNDGLKSDKVLNILSGNITVSAADDGIKSDYVMNIGADGMVGPTINVTDAVEGIEAATLNVYTGTVTVSASDDGINAANSDLKNYAYSYNQYGGRVWVNVTNGDGIDSNGSINLYGGTLEIYAPSQGDGDPLDSETGTSFEGATVLAVGHAGMMQRYSASTPYVVFGGTEGGFGGAGAGQVSLVSAGSELRIVDADGDALYSATAPKNASYVIFASPSLKEGVSYALYNGGASSATATAGTAPTSGMRTGGQRQSGFGKQDGERPTPPEGENGERPTTPEGENGERPTLPDGEKGGRRTPPDGGNGQFPTRPDGNNNGEAPTPPDGAGGEAPTPPDNADGAPTALPNDSSGSKI